MNAPDTFVFDELERWWFKVQLDHRSVIAAKPPTFIYERVKERIEQDLPTIRDTIERIRPYAFHEKLNAISRERQNDTDPYWNNDYLFEGDARALCGIIATYLPKRIVEIGSGNTTKFMSWASRTFNTETRITSIDPRPRAEIDRLCDKTIRKSLLDVEPHIFSDLDPGDFLFLDGSHLTFNGTDTTWFFLEVLPLIDSGVIVHVHDISLPFEYREEFSKRGYSEQYMLATMLLNNANYRIMLPMKYAEQEKLFPMGGGSFWMTSL